MVCRFNPSLFVARMREVGGLDFDTAPRTTANGVPTLPMIVPFVDHRYGRATVLNERVVALSLYDFVNFATAKLHVRTRAELSARFLISEAAQVLVSGVDKDGPIERWWITRIENAPSVTESTGYRPHDNPELQFADRRTAH